jgi:DNA-binding response OmpR family regulator
VARGTVLIVEDEHLLGNNLQEYLRRRGWLAGLARSGEDALDEFERMRPCVLLMDYELPGMDGFQTLGAIRARHSSCGCILMTAHTGEIVVRQAREHQITQVLYKPFPLSEMEHWLLAEALRCGCGSGDC